MTRKARPADYSSVCWLTGFFLTQTGRMNLNVLQSGGQLLLVPQFTLAADTNSGNRPSFTPPHPRLRVNACSTILSNSPETGWKMFKQEFLARICKSGWSMTVP